MKRITRTPTALTLGTTFLIICVGIPTYIAEAGVTSSKFTPSTHMRAGVCEVSGGTMTAPGFVPPSASPHPSAVDVVWLPGLNDRTCRAVLVKGGGRIASLLAQDIDSARFVPNDAGYSCPIEDGASARMYFSYGHRRVPQRIDALFGGCGWITAPDKGTRESTSKFQKDLVTLAPVNWRRYLTPTSGPSG
jgi:hypothetical protein